MKPEYLLVGIFTLAPRLVLLFMGFFTDLVRTAFGGILIPLLGFILLPFTTLAYVLVWDAQSEGPDTKGGATSAYFVQEAAVSLEILPNGMVIGSCDSGSIFYATADKDNSKDRAEGMPLDSAVLGEVVGCRCCEDRHLESLRLGCFGE